MFAHSAASASGFFVWPERFSAPTSANFRWYNLTTDNRCLALGHSIRHGKQKGYSGGEGGVGPAQSGMWWCHPPFFMLNIKNWKFSPDVLWMLDLQSHSEINRRVFTCFIMSFHQEYSSFFVKLGKIIYRVLLLRAHEYGAWAKCYSHSEVEELKKSCFHFPPEIQSRYHRDFTPELISYSKQSASSYFIRNGRKWPYLRFDVRWLVVWVIFPTQLKSVTLLTGCRHAVNDRLQIHNQRSPPRQARVVSCNCFAIKDTLCLPVKCF